MIYELKEKLDRLVERAQYYSEPVTLEAIRGLAELAAEAVEASENAHDECHTDDTVRELISDETSKLRERIEGLEALVKSLQSKGRRKKLPAPEVCRSQFRAIQGGAA